MLKRTDTQKKKENIVFFDTFPLFVFFVAFSAICRKGNKMREHVAKMVPRPIHLLLFASYTLLTTTTMMMKIMMVMVMVMMMMMMMPWSWPWQRQSEQTGQTKRPAAGQQASNTSRPANKPTISQQASNKAAVSQQQASSKPTASQQQANSRPTASQQQANSKPTTSHLGAILDQDDSTLAPPWPQDAGFFPKTIKNLRPAGGWRGFL